jgi:all-trans-retinol dehydrogenase (NAD+)
MKLAGKRVLITGAGHGLGRAIALEFARASCEVVITDRDESRADGVVGEIQNNTARAVGFTLDVTDGDQIRTVRERLLADVGPIDVLVNNAGVVFGGEFSNVPVERHLKTIEINLASLIAVTHAFLPDLVKQPESRIINIASAAAVLALPLAASYAASKWGVLGFSDSLREELRRAGHRNVGVTTICPSYISTGLFDGARPARLTSMLTPDGVALAVRRAVERGTDFVMLPRSAHVLYVFTRFLPRSMQNRICRWLGVSDSMAAWRGHN